MYHNHQIGKDIIWETEMSDEEIVKSISTSKIIKTERRKIGRVMINDSFKFILAVNEQKDHTIIKSSICDNPYDCTDSFLENYLKMNLSGKNEIIGGGYIQFYLDDCHNEIFELQYLSEKFGKAPMKVIKSILEKHFPERKVIIKENY